MIIIFIAVWLYKSSDDYNIRNRQILRITDIDILVLKLMLVNTTPTTSLASKYANLIAISTAVQFCC